MFNLVIVDDEDIILKGLSTYIAWNNLNFHLVGTAHSMQEALDLINQHPVDVVLTDIRMEFETGIDLISHLSTSHPMIKTIILSGYEDFEYARQALRYGTFDFLTKPVNFELLYDTFRRLNELLLDEELQRQSSLELEEFRKTTFLNNLVKEDQELDYDMARLLDVPLCANHIYLLRIGLENTLPSRWQTAKQELKTALLSSSLQQFPTILFNNTPSELCMIVYDTPAAVFLPQLEDFLHTLAVPPTIGLSACFFHLKDANTAYFQAGKALSYRIMKRNTAIIPFEQIENILYIQQIISPALNEKIRDYLLLKDIAGLTTLVKEEVTQVSRHSSSLNVAYSFCIELYLIIYQFLKTHTGGIPDSDVHHVLKQLLVRDSLEDIIQYTTGFITEYTAVLQEITLGSNDTIKTAQNYILEHFAENITLNTLAEILFIHPIYLSKLFKEKTGQNFIDYLTEVRMDQAKKLLTETSLKVYDVSEMVGYESSKYFSKIFKDVVGTTPKLYREQALHPTP